MKAHLTDIGIKKLSLPGSGQITYWDVATPGFGVRCSAKSKAFVVMYSEQRRLKTLGHYPGLSLSDARAQAKQFFVEFEKNEVSECEQLVTFLQARGLFLEDSGLRNKPRTVADYTRLLKRHFSFKGGLSHVSRQQIMKVVSGLSRTPSEQSHAYVAIRTMMNWCVRQGLIEYSVVPQIKHGSKSRDHVLTERELGVVFRLAKETPFPFGPIIQLLLLTGQRRSEIGHLRRSWIHGAEILFPEGFTKNKRPHCFPLCSLAQRVLTSLPDTGDLLFPSATDFEKPFSGWAWHKTRFDEALDDVLPFTLHDLRRTYATIHAKIGTPIHVTEKLLNHVSGSISGVAAVYNRHSYMEEMREANNRFGIYMEGISHARPENIKLPE